MNRKNTKTAEQRQAEREALLATLGDKVAALASSDEWLAYLRFMAAFRRYSFNNLMLIAAQCPQATHVAGYRKWQQLGRQVRKGEKAIKILGYSTKKITKTDPETGEEVEDRLVRYPVLSVFDISQTDGDPVPADRYQLPSGDGPDGALDRLTAWLTGEGWTLRSCSLGGMRGIHRPRAPRHRHRNQPRTGRPAGRAAARSRARRAARRPRCGRVPGAPRRLRDRSRIDRLRARQPARPRRRRQLDQLHRRLVARRPDRAHRGRHQRPARGQHHRRRPRPRRRGAADRDTAA